MVCRALLLIAITWGLAGCNSCKSDGDESPPTEPEPAPVVTDEPEPEVDPLEEARLDAMEKARALFLPISDQAQFVASDIEAAGHKAAAPVRKPRVKEPETGEIKNMAQFRTILSQNQGAMQNCYERALRRNPSLQGRVSLNLLISSTGKVSEAKAQGAGLRDPAVMECMETHARTMQFPRPEGGAVRMNIPYVFSPQL